MKHVLVISFLVACVPPQGGGGSTMSPTPSGGEAAETQPATGGNGGTSRVPAVVSVNIHSDCANTVKVFYGDKPKFGSGTYSTISSHSSESHQFKPGDMVWIVDGAENGLASTTIGAGMAEINIGASCTSFVAR